MLIAISMRVKSKIFFASYRSAIISNNFSANEFIIKGSANLQCIIGV